MHNCSEKDFTYGTTCSYKCNRGYEISGPVSRTCLFNKWTGIDVTCTEITCPALDFPNNGMHNCSEKDFTYGTTCTYKCNRGYEISGPISRTCLFNKWTGIDVTCTEITCPALDFPNNGMHNCSEKVFTYGTTCSYKCNRGYELSGSVSRICLFNSWTGTNVTCKDREPPQILFCPADILQYHRFHVDVPVEWEEPIFKDNSNKLKSVTASSKSGDKFSWGPAVTVIYEASDEAGNTANCTFQVKVKHYPCPFYPPPANGVLACDTWLDGRFCLIHCHDGFEFADSRDIETMFYCWQVRKADRTIEGVWHPFRAGKIDKLRWLDCSRKENPSSLNVTAGLSSGAESCSEENLKKFRQKFLAYPVFQLDRYCPKDKGCSPENIHISCSPGRVKRSFQSDTSDKNKRDSSQVLTVSFNVQVDPSATDDIPENPTNDEIHLQSAPFMKELEDKISLNVKEAYNVDTVPEPIVNLDVVGVCSVGQTIVNNTCVNCPAGTYKDSESGTCIDCPPATYQDEERQLSCKACPVGFTTHEIKSKSADDCKGPCQSGTYSDTTFEPCLACPMNTYQEKNARKECMKCPSGKFTWRVGANSLADCVASCKPGTYSDTGYEPCTQCEIGSFQDMDNQTNCTVCPDRTTTSAKGATRYEDCKDTGYCSEYGKTYVNGETWVHNCQNCFCKEGIVQCEAIQCNETSCLPEETMLISPGECCPKCVAWGFCVIFPNSSILSFDLSTYEISGSFNYTVVEDCVGGRFKVDIEFPADSTQVVIYQDYNKMTVTSDGAVTLDGDQPVSLPFVDDLWNAEEVNNSVSVRANADLTVDWDLKNEVVIALPVTRTSKVCGLCSRMEEFYAHKSGK